MADRVASVISSDPPPPLPEIEVLKLASGESLLYPVDIAHDDSVVAWYLQAAGDTWADKAAYDDAARSLIAKFAENFVRFDVDRSIVDAGPSVELLDKN